MESGGVVSDGVRDAGHTAHGVAVALLEAALERDEDETPVRLAVRVEGVEHL